MRRSLLRWICPGAVLVLTAAILVGDQGNPSPAGTDSSPGGAKVSYQLPVDGPLPKTYRVTLAAMDAKNPSWVVSTFAAGLVRTVTAENQGKFTETWDGLDDNFMPVPTGPYGLKGIYMPAEKWAIDGQYHTIVPKLASVGSSWGQTPVEDLQKRKIEGDPVGSPLRDVDVEPDGKGVLYFQYLENGTNAFLTDFTKPIGADQITKGFDSGGIGGGLNACTDGQHVWIIGDVDHQFVMHADGTAFGSQHSLYCSNVYLPDGWVTGMSAWRDPEAGHSILFLAEHGKVGTPAPEQSSDRPADKEQVVVLDGQNAAPLATWKLERPLSVKVRGGRLYVLHSVKGRYEVLSTLLESNWRTGKLARLLTVPAGIVPFDVEVDSHRRIYLSDSRANHVYQLDLHGKLLKTLGRLNAQRDGAYDPNTFMAPEKLSCWTDATGHDRLLVVEQGGPNRLSEWSGDDGTLIRQWVVPQTRANDGYAIDPRHPNLAYMEGQGDVLVRWKIDYATGQWNTNAVWSKVGMGFGPDSHSNEVYFQGLASPRIIYRGNDRYIAFGRGYGVYHFEGNRCRACAAVIHRHDVDRDGTYFWRDSNGDGLVEESEYLPYATSVPPGVFDRYFGDAWFDDLSLICIGTNSPDIWRLPPASFDRRGTPIYDPQGWQKMLTDDVFVTKKAGTATATHGGNEMLSTGFDSAWAWIAQGAQREIYVNARSGPDFSSNMGGQSKLSRYDPDGSGGYRQRWRVGRLAIQGNARPGEVYGSIYVCPPVNGLVGIVDSARAGFEIYTTDGLYVDTLFPDDHVVSHDQMGAYWQPGEFFSGSAYVNTDGKVYLAMGKTMPEIYAAQGWSTAENRVHILTTLDRTVTLRAGDIAAPPALALQIRGGSGAARVAQFSPEPGGGPTIDGSMHGWEACDPVTFGSEQNQNVEVRCFYDLEHLYLRWHARTAHVFAARSLQPIQHVFAHDRENDTLGLYLQGDPNAPSGAASPGGRPGDVRFIFGVFKDGGTIRPEVIGMYPTWSGADAAPVTYRTPVGSVRFARVDRVPGVRAAYQVDGDGHGFVLAASIPRSAVPDSAALEGWHTEGNFDANLGGVNRFWWSNADGSASREVFDEPTEARFYPGSWSPVQLVAINTLPIHSWMVIGPFGFPDLPKLDVLASRDEIIRRLLAARYPPDTQRDWQLNYGGGFTQTRAAQRNLKWNEVEPDTDRVDFGKALGWSGAGNEEGVAYAVTHIHAARAVAVTLHTQLSGGDHDLEVRLNGTSLPEMSRGGQSEWDVAKSMDLKAGWNELIIRYTYVWGENYFGASLTAPPAILWDLKISARGPG